MKMTKMIACIFIAGLILIPIIMSGDLQNCMAQQNNNWRQHDMSRPFPAVIAPGTASTAQKAGQPPSDAVVLFDGKDLLQWRSMDGTQAKWQIKEDYVEISKGGGTIRTYQNFGDIQLHIEWATPLPASGQGQGRGNSGVLLMGKYEVQVLDSYNNITYPDGQAAAIYSQMPPLVNACRPPGEWQSYDIIFHGPRFSSNGDVVRPANVTVLHNGVLVQDHVELKGEVTWIGEVRYQAHPEKLPLMLQDHGNPIRFRNIWIRELDAKQRSEREVTVSSALLDDYTGDYKTRDGRTLHFSRKENHLLVNVYGETEREIFASSDTTFFAKDIDFEFTFQSDDAQKVNAVKFRLADSVASIDKVK